VSRSEYLVLAAVLIIISLSLLMMIRGYWVLQQRVKWINADVDDFIAKAPTYERMLFTPWIWDMRRFGFIPAARKGE
jgi:hypothetical protein